MKKKIKKAFIDFEPGDLVGFEKYNGNFFLCVSHEPKDATDHGVEVWVDISINGCELCVVNMLDLKNLVLL